MRIITESDPHLEFGPGWMLPPAENEALDQILRKWKLMLRATDRYRMSHRVLQKMPDVVPA